MIMQIVEAPIERRDIECDMLQVKRRVRIEMCRNYTASKVMQFRKRNQRKVFDALRFEVVHEIDPEGSVTPTPQENALSLIHI